MFIHRNSPKRKVEKYFRENGYINRDICYKLFGTKELSKIMSDLKQEGLQFEIVPNQCQSSIIDGLKQTVWINGYYLKDNKPTEITEPKYSKILFIEDGSIDIDELKDLKGIKIIVYRQGSQRPELIDIGE